MKQEIKNELSRQRITAAAIEEFGKGTYDSVSITQICTRHNIAKGLLYHYYRGKDELYLACVKKCFDELGTYLAEAQLKFSQFKRDIVRYMKKRSQFFEENPDLGNIFFQSMIYPPEHLLVPVREMRKKFDLLNEKYFRQLLQSVKLRADVTEQEATEFYLLVRDSYHIYIRNYYTGKEEKDIRKVHEKYISKVLDRILYGIAEEKKE